MIFTQRCNFNPCLCFIIWKKYSSWISGVSAKNCISVKQNRYTCWTAQL